MQESREQMRERAHQLQGEIGRMFDAGKTKSASHMATLVDTIEHLGIDHCFHEEIVAAMSRVRSEELEFSSSNDLHVVALRFRLLRQHGIWVSADVFDKFRDGKNGSFSSSLCSNPRGLLSLYNAAHLAVPGEKTLDDAIAFAKHHLEALRDELRWPLAEQVSRALDIPLPRISRRVESMHYIAEYEQEEGHHATLLELARLDFELVRCLHLEELSELSLWDESAVSVVPEYLRTLYLRTLRGFQEFEDIEYVLTNVRTQYKLLSEYYLQEATWANENHEPSFAEHVRVSTISSGLPMLVPVILTGLPSSRDPAAIREAFAWADGDPEMVLASGQVGRFLNDMASYTLGKNKKDVANAHECYMKEFGVTGPQAFAAIAGMTENAWRTINRGCMMEVDPAVRTAVVDLSRSMEIIYLGGRRDAYTFASNLKDLVTSLFLRPIHGGLIRY
ncbi:hypothetical protein PR202_ga25678 [Eleusine coracana subsp. coracana]|uniref:Terpene synthase n=1 Tax=Eleusine coracana subsp. coracana TaxID=191504 RepID=A0AAV5D9W0_ELECO|nr:hypothetical protein PR202_ga25678 [Eleusine coracana subsp. coracana]